MLQKKRNQSIGRKIDLTVLTIGESPVTRFIPWRLSCCAGCKLFSVQENQGSATFKSSFHGQNYYTPQIVSKSIEELVEMIKSREQNLVDLIILSCVSLSKLRDAMVKVKPLIKENTIVLLDGNYSLGLEEVLKEDNPLLGCFTILTDVEMRLTEPYYYTIYGTTCQVKIGYSSKADDHELERVIKYFDNENSIVNVFVEKLREAQVVTIKVYRPSSFVLDIWYHLIPKYVHILALVFEDWNFENYPYSNHYSVCQSLCYELLKVAELHTQSTIDAFREDKKIDIQSILNIVMKTHEKLPKSASELSSAPYEVHSFYNFVDVPIHLLLSTPISIAAKKNINTPSLNFLLALASKIYSQQGFDIEQGFASHCVEPSFSMYTRRNAVLQRSQQSSNSSSTKTYNGFPLKRWRQRPKKQKQPNAPPPTAVDDIPEDLQELYLGITSSMDSLELPNEETELIMEEEITESDFEDSDMDPAHNQNLYRSNLKQAPYYPELPEHSKNISNGVYYSYTDPYSRQVSQRSIPKMGALEQYIRRQNVSSSSRSLISTHKHANSRRFQREKTTDLEPSKYVRRHQQLLSTANTFSELGQDLLEVTTSRYGAVDATQTILHNNQDGRPEY